MEKTYQSLLDGNKAWVNQMVKEDKDFFKRQEKGQKPQILWIGCSDSRVPANQVTGTNLGEVFVHRNIANMVVHTDMNMLSVLDFAVNILEVKHIIVCGHYGCGGIQAAMSNRQFGLVDNWIRHIKDVYRLYHLELDAIKDENARLNRFVELNVMEQVIDLCKTSILQNAWENKRSLHIHGWVYNVGTGYIKDLEITVRDNSEMQTIYRFEKDRKG